MKDVAKYNINKGVSTGLTVGTPIVTLALNGDFFRHRSDTAMSAAAIFVLLICVFLFKDKILENFKMPPVAILCLIMFILIAIIESIIVPIKNVCIMTMISTGIDEFTFKKSYKNLERCLPENASEYKHMGFIFTTTNKLKGGDNT